jgi:hypothetical protein
MKLFPMWICVFLIAALAAPAAMADTKDAVTYTINFTGTAPFPTAGSFTYDPDTHTFSSFVVTWRGISFDLTTSANHPALIGTPCGALTGGAATFALLNGTCALDTVDWFGHISPRPEFGFTTFVDSTDEILVFANAGSTTPPYNVAGGTWSITLKAPIAKLVTPANGATNVFPVPVHFTWTAAPNAQDYMLYVGTSLGASNAVNSGATLLTSWQARLNPTTHYYVRVWTKLGGQWTNNYSDTTFTTGTGIAQLLTPANGATNVDPHLPVRFTWTSVPTAQDYELYVGTTLGANNIVNSGPTLLTSWQATMRPTIKYYVRLSTKVGGLWYYNATTFSTGP